jgi:hypothetical protein
VERLAREFALQELEADIHRTSEERKGKDWWDDALDIISDWNEIQKHI